MKHLALLTCLASVTSVQAAVTADPLTLHQDTPSWVQVANDDFIGKSPDDQWTAAIHGGVAYDQWHLGAEYDIYTDKTNNTRIDTISGTVGRDFAIGNLAILPAIGVSYNGNLDGYKVQTNWHRKTHVATVHGQYDAAETTPLALMDMRYRIPVANESTIYPIVQIETDGHTLVLDVYAQVTYTNMVGSDSATFFLAPHYIHTAGHAVTPTREATNQYYNEFALAAGFKDGPVIVNISVGLKGSYGEVGFSF